VADSDALIRAILDNQRQLREWFAEDRNHPLFDLNITMSQLKVMILLYNQGGASGADLARRFNISLATLSGIVDRLVAQDLVTRHEDAKDRRVRRIELTPVGHDTVDRIISAGEANLTNLLRRLEPTALHTVAEAFTLLVSAARTPR
jgi:DNA-binding MarR family transcriptional regulator